MQIHFTGRNIRINPRVKQVTTEKMQRLESRNKSITDIHVRFISASCFKLLKATVHVVGAEFHATSRSEDMYSAIDDLVDKCC